ncbi:Histidine triad (HIT) protein [Kalmanozyma brasiliensis GHG001]|uniref:Histidine triad (HIT) protein n=1 Tax=Kalmanozyma brasiliensis (strain GHG001) TaxID=1365824 RepID=UPI0028682BEB|nr:Histidine triad (HIT) protein [Kalmanozyma brasiliensis GHG001]EST08466.2 Histidine triad (HIT) protein [Kalmanozyma brasiliensis GHG001]
MTSHTLARFDASKDLADDCAFCKIIAGKSSAFVVYEDESNIAFLDILPLRPGHTLVIPKMHVQQLSHLEPGTAASLSNALVQTTRAIGKALGDERLQVITNQIYAQLVPHVHFHIVPAAMRPSKDDKTKKSASSNPLAMMGLGHGREELDDEEAEELAKKIREAAAQLKNGPSAKL